MQLFVQRARQVQPGLALDEATLTTIVQICQHVAGMPLAIELAAAGVRTLPLAEIERQIRANLDVLATTCAMCQRGTAACARCSTIPGDLLSERGARAVQPSGGLPRRLDG